MTAPITLLEQIDCITRELKMRDRVYRKRVLEGKMSKEVADQETRCMTAVLKTLKGLDQPELI